VKNKMSKGDGMSYAEFSYPLMQAWDWWYMFHTKSIQMQIGGSDQFGNITAGIDAVKYISAHHSDPDVRSAARAVGEPFGFTVPLLTTSYGQKFGKTAKNAIWLDSEMTSSFDLYGYLLRTSDADVGKYLKMFTFLPIHEIDSLVAKHMESPSQRIAQHALAGNFVELVHGVDEAVAAETQHRLIFRKGPPAVDVSSKYPDGNARAAAAGIITHNNKPKTDLKLPRSVIYQKSIGKILFATGLVESASQGHRLANEEGAYIGGKPDQKTKKPMLDGIISWAPIKNWVVEDTSKYLIHNDLLLFRKGKHNVRIVQVVSNEEYALSGKTFPGMTQEWRNEVLAAIAIKKQVLQGEKEAIKELDENVLHTGSDAEAEPEKSATHSA
jgi:tyrosyl-tRNA synthetase